MTQATSILTRAAVRAQASMPPTVSTPELYRALLQGKLHKKGVEEKTVDYERRVAKFQFKGNGVDSVLFAKFKPSRFEDICEPTFDADAEEVSFTCTFKEETHEAHGMIVPIRQSPPVAGTYTAANAFNRQVKVSKVDYSRDVLLLNTEEGRFLKGPAQFLVKSLKSKAGQLKSDFEKLEVGIAFKLRPPFVDQLINGTTPTISDARDITISSNAVVGTVIRVYIFKSGQNDPIKVYDVKAQPDGITGAFVAVSFPEYQP